MMKTDYIIYGILAVVVAGLVYAVWGLIDQNEKTNDAAAFKYRTITTGDTSNGNVQIELTPKGIANGKFEVEIAANTHSVSLDEFDLGQITTLTYDGQDHKPITTPQLSGHHSSGTITFDLGIEPDNFKITIKGIPSISERIFEWMAK